MVWVGWTMVKLVLRTVAWLDGVRVAAKVLPR